VLVINKPGSMKHEHQQGPCGSPSIDGNVYLSIESRAQQ